MDAPDPAHMAADNPFASVAPAHQPTDPQGVGLSITDPPPSSYPTRRNPITEPGTSAELVHVVPDLSKAAQVMESRKSIRRWRGTSQPTRPGLTWALFLGLVLVLLYISELSGWYTFTDLQQVIPDIPVEGNGTLLLMSFGVSVKTSNEDGIVDSWEIVISLAIFAGLLILIYLVIKTQVYYRLWLGNWILATYLAFSVLFRSLSAEDEYSPAYVIGPLVLIIFITYLVYALVVMFLWHKVPDLQLRKGWFLPKTWSQRVFPVPRVTKQLISQTYKMMGREGRLGDGVAAVKIHYSSFIGRWLPRFLRKLCKCVYTVTYSGEVDKNGLPHGLGEWNDTYYHGEVLIGWWEHGAPRGPFHSQEAGSGAGFKRLLIPYFRNRTDGLNAISKKIEHGAISCGILEVECCTAGVFFREYPKAAQYHEVQPSGSLRADIREVLDKLLPSSASSSGSIVVQADALRGLLVSAHSAAEGDDPSSVVIELCDHSGKKLERTKTKIANFASILARNYAHRPVQDEDATGSSSAGSFFGTAEIPTALPPDDEDDVPMALLMVQPTLNVPGWRESSYKQNNEALIFLPGFNSATVGSAKLLAQLLALGNFPSYLKPFVYSWPGGDLMGFASAQSKGAESKQTSEDLKTFLLALGDTGITNIHIFTHSMGVRVLTAALPTLEDIFVPANPLAASNSREGPERSMRLSTVMILNPEMGRHEFVDCHARRLTDMCGCVSVYADANDVALIGSELQNSLCNALWPNRRTPEVVEDLSKAPLQKQQERRQKRKWEYSLGRIKKDLLYADGQLVDVDVIQTTHLGANVQETRHNAWGLNRELVDDLRDTIINKQRAFQRGSRLQYRGGNRYNFCVAPTHVVNP